MVLVCAPPLLLTVTPGAIWADEDVVLLVDVDPVAVPVVDVAADPVDDSPDVVVLLDVEPAELVVDDSADVPVVSAAATP